MSVKIILEHIGASDDAVLWGAAYGDDMRRAWEECCHPEMMLPIAAGVGVPNFIVINAGVEVVCAHLINICFPAHAKEGIDAIERFICMEITQNDLASMLDIIVAKAGSLREKRGAEKGALGAVAHLVEAALFGDQRLLAPMMNKLSQAVFFSAYAMAEAIGKGSPDNYKRELFDRGLVAVAPIVRRFIPYESMAGGFIASMGLEEAEMPVA